MTRRRLVLGTALVALISPALMVSRAAAAPPQFDHSVEPFSDVIEDFCDVTGLTVVDAGTFTDSAKIRTQRSGLQFGLEHITIDETVTGVASGRSVRIHTAILQKDLKVTDNGDGTITIISLLTGPSSVYGPDGKAIARDPGQVRFRIVIADAGTPNNPDDDFVVSFDRIKGSTGRSDDYCAAIVPIIG
jgi:hypothetical protein